MNPLTGESPQAGAVPAPEPSQSFDVHGQSAERIAVLERELMYTKVHLQSTIEQLETSNEELRSVNEELQTVNAKHQRKIDELTQLTSKRAENDAHDALARRDQFLAMLSHELRNPLAAILNATQVLRSSQSDEAMLREANLVIQRQVDQLSRLLDDLLDVTRIAQNRIRLHGKPIDLRETVGEAVRATQATYQVTGAELLVGVAAPPLIPVRPTSVLIIEDNADSRRMLETMLKLDGYEVHSAEDGDRGLIELFRLRPRFAIVDIGLPGLDGYQVARKVRETIGPDEVTLIALTGYGRPKDRQAVKEAGFDEHLIKPLKPEELAKVLRKSRQHTVDSRQ